jgi:hypothetical protein
MSDLDFGSSARKMEREREKRAEELRKRKQKEDAKAAFAQEQQRRMEAMNAERRLRELAQQAVRRLEAV